MKTILFTLTLLFSTVLIPSATNAQMGMQCVPYEYSTNTLMTEFNEVTLYRGVEKSGKAMVEVWANLETGTFTIMRVLQSAGGKAICATIHGDAFYKIDKEDQKQPEKLKKDENKT